MALFVESVWIWVVIAAVVFAFGYSMFVNDKRNRTLLVTVLASAIVLCGGLALERYVETDKEAIRRTMREIATIIKADDLERVKTYTAPDAEQLRDLATRGMGMAKLTVVNFSNINIKLNDATVPMTAELNFTAAFRGRTKDSSLFGDGDFFNQYQFTVLFEKHGDRWLATDDIIFDGRFPIKFDMKQQDFLR